MSAVWNFYKVCEKNITIAICNVCKNMIPRGGNKLKSFNTTNLIRHLKTHHPAKHSEFLKISAASGRKMKAGPASKTAPKHQVTHGRSQHKRTTEIGCQTEPDSTNNAAGDVNNRRSKSTVPRTRSTPVKRTRSEVSTDDSSHQPDVTSSTMNCTSFQPLADLQESSSPSSSTAGPTTSTSDVATKNKWEQKILRCGRCRQPQPPKDPEGLLLWVQCECCHKLFHTICVSSEMDLDEDEFWCFWCLDV
ncbi:zinc finger BED domain-containing protein 6-like isoform X1 [Etheostoma cragini]|uniref:zinc finger BED domain-containing protein 6-like isoform X1 n=1 Tax=Etheostoma cragini TaxID=417921 RepID=UPI00155ED1E1|nr:zinc finger BED domain-containing protein 6-like isoform X1 [Etheostoma cragini]